MARTTQSSPTHNLVGRISDAIASHSRLSAAVAFQMGVLLGQVLNNAGTFSGLKKTMAAAPGAVASHIPTFGLFEGKARKRPRRRQASSAASRTTARKTRATSRKMAKRHRAG
jgi:hypothetical protein